ncbi:MAG: hypothetical protein OES90_04915 [Xanthomonadales bacterium]|nr:hypothetical protein [Xanthomonadales bacterium]
MNRHLLRVLLLTGLLLPLALPAQDAGIDAGLKAAIDINVEQDREIWAGQQVTLMLDLKTTGFSFSNTHFNLPEVSGAFLMQTDTTTIKLTEKIDGRDWQIIRYPLALYPQNAERLQVPPIDVRFTTSAGFGSEEKAFEFKTDPLDLTINLPPGAKPGELIVTTTSFELEHDWQPAKGTSKTGDAVTLTVNRRAGDISAMLLPPLPVFRTEGLAAYPQEPDVNDKTDRGDLTGERSDSITWVIEQAGYYEIPGIRFQWWDPDSLELKQQIIPGMSLDIAPVAAEDTVTVTAGSPGTNSGWPLKLWIAVIAALLAFVLWLLFRRKLHEQHPVNERTTFTRLTNACKNNQAGQTYTAIHAWLEFIPLVAPNHPRPLTLNEFAGVCEDRQLAIDLDKLQSALVISASDWQGDALLSSLQRIRRRINRRKPSHAEAYLAPLNP